MKKLVSILFLVAGSFAQAYAHDGLYKSFAKPYAVQCETKASSAGVSRPNAQILTNNCLHDFIIKAARKIVAEVPEYAEASGRDRSQSLREAREDVVKALQMYQRGVFIHPASDEASMGAQAQKGLEIELGRKIDQLKIMEDQPALMYDQD